MPPSLTEGYMQVPGSASDRTPAADSAHGRGRRPRRLGMAAFALAAAMATTVPAGPPAESLAPGVPGLVPGSGLEPPRTGLTEDGARPSSSMSASAASSSAVAPGPLDAPAEPMPPPPVPRPDSEVGEEPSPGLPGASAGEDDPRALAPPWRTRFWSQTVRDAGSIAISPTRWNGRDYALATAVLGGTAGLLFADRDVRGRVVRDCDPRSCRESQWVKWAGDGWVTVPALGVLYGLGASRGNDRLRKTSLASFESFLVANLYSQTIKRVFNRERPAFTDDPWNWQGPTLSGVNLAFPSGHAVAAWSVFSVWALEYDETIWVPVAAYALAGAVSASRVWDNRHWTSDAFFGSALGFVVARSIVRRHPPSTETGSAGMVPPQAGVDERMISVPVFVARPRAARVSWVPWFHEGSPGLAFIVSLP